MLELIVIVGFLCRTSAVVLADEGGRAVFLTVSRSNGLNSAVSVEWEMQSNTATAAGEITKLSRNPKVLKSSSFLFSVL